MPYLVRSVFEFIDGQGLSFDEGEIRFEILGYPSMLSLESPIDGQTSGCNVVLSIEVPTLKNAQEILMLTQNALHHYIVTNKVGLNLGRFQRTGGISPWFARVMQEADGRPRLNAYFGSKLFEVPPRPIFVDFSAKVSVIRQAKLFCEEITSYYEESNYSMTVLQAIDIYSTSKFEKTIEAKFLTLIYAIESLANTQPVDDDQMRIIDECVECVRKSSLDTDTQKLLMSRLGSLKRESISAAVKRVIRDYVPRDTVIMGVDPQRLFSDLYNIRSKYVHGDFAESMEQMTKYYQGAEELFLSLIINLPKASPLAE
ncbi:MAG: hypothetical protein JNM28_01075 [Armatimonadetes bacterium]|nr:hypothetical protein [Armatimonadota bacterium]